MNIYTYIYREREMLLYCEYIHVTWFAAHTYGMDKDIAQRVLEEANLLKAVNSATHLRIHKAHS